jgi:hypothetical protein
MITGYMSMIANKPLLSQTIYTDVDGSIINVSKIYTNNIYFGV